MRIPPLLPIALSVVVAACGDAPPGVSARAEQEAASFGAIGPGDASAASSAPTSSTEPTSIGPGGSELVRPPDSEGSQPLGSREEAEGIRVLFLGTSLTEGLGLELPSRQAWPARVETLADSAGLAVEALNAGIGGETSAGALSRLDWVLQQDPDVLVVETGANDGLRGLPVRELESNLDEMVRQARESRPQLAVVLAQMEAPPNMGPDYASAFRAVYPAVAARQGVPLIPFLLDGVAGNPDLNQRDGIHPTQEGHWMMARQAWPVLETVLRSIVDL